MTCSPGWILPRPRGWSGSRQAERPSSRTRLCGMSSGRSGGSGPCGAGARLYERALRLLDSGGFTGTDRGRLLLGSAEALYKAGGVNRAITAAGQAGDEARRCGDPAGMARAALVLEGVADEEWGRRVVQLAESALPELGAGDAELSARLLPAIAIVQKPARSAGNTDEAGPLSLRALTLAEGAGTPAALVSALRARQMACAGPDGVGVPLEVADRMPTLAAEGV